MSDNISIKGRPGRVIYISHGGGPLPLLGDERHRDLVALLKELPGYYKKPSAIIVFSAHWEEETAFITGSPAPELIYDYYNFPPESYSIKYPAPGVPELAGRISKLLDDSNISNTLTKTRGFDHGVFIPLKIMYPEGDIPCIQVSLLKGLDPGHHIQLGRALSPILDEPVLLIGSGFSFHNMRAFFVPPKKEEEILNEAFDKYLIETCIGEEFSGDEREKRLTDWEQAPGARYCHPREEHLIPLHVCYGAADRAAERVFSLKIMDRKASAFLW